uniref:Kunitz/Bovine pancreatic trypsin inhibitor domain protein n=1 Tax=Bursaphelenchus xylophilus TaxID=6326 RepID=A0A1I7RSZ6_BURXY
MRRIDALSVALCALLLVQTVISQEADPCKRQPFRGRCPGTGPNGQPQRSQFVLRYYLRSGECVSYPYGHCSNDENEPKLFRYKEECEDACIGDKEVVEHTQSPNSVQTYATMSPGKSECQKQRELKGSGNLVKGAYVPECEADGSFKALQCEQDGLTCFCVDRSGIELTNSRCQPGQPKPDCEKIAAAPPMRSNECTGGVNAGPCQGHIPRWFYDERTLQCKQFDYSGCGGNGNNYATEVACKLRCAPQPEAKDQFCHSGLPLKNPEGSLADCSKSSCPSGFKCNNLPTQSVCCPDVEKNAEAGVLDSGRKANPCSLPKERGPCDKYELRFYYSAELKECKYFFYGGCDGNANNFGRKEECDQVCNAGQAVNAGETPTAAPATEVQEQTTAQETVVPAVTTEVIPENEPEPIQTTVDTFEPSTTTVVERTTVDQTLVKLNSKEEEATEERPEDRQTTVAEIEAPSEQKATTEEQKTETEAPANEATTQQAVQVDSEAQAEEKSEQKETSKPIDNGTEDSELTQRPVQETEVPTQPQTQPPETVAPVQTRPPRPQTKRPPPPTTTAVPLPTNRCQHPVDSGNCGGRFDRWIWNAEKRICESFIYTGCGGNGNNFGSREECLSICHIEVVPKVSPKEVDLENVCDAEIDAGNCGGSFLRFAFDKETKDCKQFNYGGCGGNGNNFANMKDCRKKCADNVQATTLPEDLCEHPVDVGECSGVFARFAYNQLTNDCQQFTYGGCGGNGNNFPNKAECLSACAKAPVINQRPHCPVLDLQSCTDPCIIFTNREGCQECVCPVTPPTFVPRPPGSFEGRPPAPPAPPAPVDIPHKQPKPPTVEGRPLKQNTENEIRDEVRPEVFPEREFPIQPAPPPRQHAIAPPDFSEPFPELGEQCTQRMDPGPCSNFVQRWFFNPAQGACEPFQYGGCAGNRNHFFTERECQIHCQRFAARVETTTEFVAPSHQFPNAPVAERGNGQQRGAEQQGERQRFQGLIEKGFRGQQQVVQQQRFQGQSQGFRNEQVPQQGHLEEGFRAQQPSIPQQGFQKQGQGFRSEQVPQQGQFEQAPRGQQQVVQQQQFQGRSQGFQNEQSPQQGQFEQRFQGQQQPILHQGFQQQGQGFQGERQVQGQRPIAEPNHRPQPSAQSEQGVVVSRPIQSGPHVPERRIQNQQFEFIEQNLNNHEAVNVDMPKSAPRPSVPSGADLKNFGSSLEGHMERGNVEQSNFPPQSTFERKDTLTAQSTSAPLPSPAFQPSENAQSGLVTRAWHFVSKAPLQPENGQPLSPQLVVPLPFEPVQKENPSPQEPPVSFGQDTKSRPVVHAQPSLQEISQGEGYNPEQALSRENNPYAVKNSQTPPPNFNIPPFKPSGNINDQYIPPQAQPSYPNQFNGPSVNNQQYIPPQPATIGPNVRPTINEVAHGNPWTSPTVAPSAQPPQTSHAVVPPAESSQSEYRKVKDLAPAPLAPTESDKTVKKVEEVKVEEQTEPSTIKTTELTTEALVEAKVTEEIKETTPEVTTEATTHRLNIKPISEVNAKAKASKIEPLLEKAIEVKTEEKEVHSGEFQPAISQKGKMPVASTSFDGNDVVEKPQVKQSLVELKPVEVPKKSIEESTLASEHLIPSFVDMDQDKDLLEPASGEEPIDISKSVDITASEAPVQSSSSQTTQETTKSESTITQSTTPKDVPTTSRATSPVPPPTTSRPAQQGLPNFRENPLPADKVIQPPTTEAPEVPEEKTTYPAEPMTTPNPALASQSTIGRIVTGGLNYQTGKQHGVKNNPSANIDESQLDLVSGKPIETLEEAAQHFDNVAACPNHKEPLRYADGNTVLCLPGRNQCPDNSVCYFNGLDFFCCPNVDDPYDNHIFGGYDGEEEKHGYKNTLNIKAIPSRARRHAAQRPLPASSFSIDHITSPLRFDGQAPKQISRAGLAGLRVNPCTQEVQKGSCEGQHLRYFYDIHSDDCRLFYFSGCDGNDNNFATQVECERRCKLGPIIEKPAPIANDKTPAGQCPNGQAPLGENAPVLCGNQTDSIGCPSGYYCREGPPDVCCPTEGNEILTPQRQWGDVRRKERVQFSASVSEKAPLPVHQAAFGVATKTQDKDLDQKIPLIEAKNEPEDISQAKQPELFPSNMCPDGSDALNGSEGKPLVCGAGLSLDGFKMCPRGFYCSMDLERNSRLCCPLEIQSSNVPPPPVVAPYLGHRHANPGEAIGRGSLPSDLRRRA